MQQLYLFHYLAHIEMVLLPKPWTYTQTNLGIFFGLKLTRRLEYLNPNGANLWVLGSTST